jgi:hypothetical protein
MLSPWEQPGLERDERLPSSLMDESKADEIAGVWVERIGARPEEWTPAIATVLSELPDPRHWAISQRDDDRLALLTDRQLYVLTGSVDSHDHLRTINLQVLSDVSTLEVSSARTYRRDSAPGHDTHSWALGGDHLYEPLTFQFGGTDDDQVHALWTALAGLA